MSLYNEADSLETYDDADDVKLIDLDLSKNLMDLISPIKSYLSDKDITAELNLYLVSGYANGPDVSLFVQYLDKIENPKNIFFRGVITADLIPLFVSNEIGMNDDTVMHVEVNKLHVILRALLPHREKFHAFIERYVEVYSKNLSNFTLEYLEYKKWF